MTAKKTATKKSTKQKTTVLTHVDVGYSAPKELMDQVEKVLNKLPQYNTTDVFAVLLAVVKRICELRFEVDAWRSLWCDQPEDRLYHAKDRTWWKRLYGPTNQGHGDSPYSPYGADPPPEIMLIVRAARKLKHRDSKLAEALSHFPK
jgi:hypothetical protein